MSEKRPENAEMLFHGAKGDKGERGEQGATGARGLPGRTARAIVGLFVLAFIVAGASLLLTAHYVSTSQAAARQQGQLLERKLCADIGTMAQLAPPAGNPATNPSRAYEQAEHRAWQGLYTGLACR